LLTKDFRNSAGVENRESKQNEQNPMNNRNSQKDCMAHRKVGSYQNFHHHNTLLHNRVKSYAIEGQRL